MSINPLNDISKIYLERVISVDEAKKGKKPNDGNLANNYPPYDKVTRGDVIAGATGKDQMGGKKKKVKEGFSNWRQDLAEVMDDEIDSKPIKEKKITNKIKINPNIGEAVEEIGGTLLEIVEVNEVDFIIESVYSELLDEGYVEDDIEEALEYALTEAKVTFGHDTIKRREDGSMVGAVKRLAKQKLKSFAKKAIVKGARAVASGAAKLADKVEGKSKPAAVHSKPGTRKEKTYRGSGAGHVEKAGSPAAKSTPKTKTQKTTAPKTKTTATKKKRKSKLDDLLSDIRNEQVQIDEKTLTKKEMSKREEIVKSMKDKASDFEKRYPGRGKEVMYATATKMAKKIAESSMEIPMSSQELALQKRKTSIESQISRKRQQQISKSKPENDSQV